VWDAVSVTEVLHPPTHLNSLQFYPDVDFSSDGTLIVLDHYHYYKSAKIYYTVTWGSTFTTLKPDLCHNPNTIEVDIDPGGWIVHRPTNVILSRLPPTISHHHELPTCSFYQPRDFSLLREWEDGMQGQG
jgi:hypothetical protein